MCLKILTNSHPVLNKPFGFRYEVETELRKVKATYTTQENKQITIISWNTAGKSPPNEREFEWTDQEKELLQKSDIVIVGL